MRAKRGYADKTHDALNRMRKNFERCRGVRLSYEELAAMSLTFIGDAWNEDDPRRTPQARAGEK